jgi:hypothetical protein
MATLSKNRALLALLAVAAALAGCSGGDSTADQPDQSPVASTDGVTSGPPESNTSGSVSADAEPVRDAFVYAAVLEQLLQESTSGRGNPPFKVLFILDGAVPRAAHPTKPEDPEAPFGHDVKDGLRFLATLSELPPLEFVATRDSAVGDTGSGKRPGEARDGGAVVTLAPIKGDERRVEVGSSIWVNGLSGRWQTYVVAETGGVWQVTGTTGPLAIS